MKQVEENGITNYLISFGTHEGMVGKNNEDFVTFVAFDSGIKNLDTPEIFHLGIVADGVGGQIAGERASRLATQTVITYFSELEEVNAEQVLVHLEKAVTLANKTLHEEAANSPEFRGMATTIAIIAVLEGLVFTTHVGDSRIYLYRNEELHQLTNDHSWVQEALEAGIITDDEARNHPNRNIIRRSLGTLETVTADQVMMSGPNNHFWQGMPLKNHDLLLICSDGLTDMIDDSDIQNSIRDKKGNTSALVFDLIEKANDAGGRDNTSVLLMQTSENFKANRLMPIPPTLEPVVHRSMVGPEPETITFVGKAIDKNAFAVPTIRSMPRISADMIHTHQNNQDNHVSSNEPAAKTIDPAKIPTVKIQTLEPQDTLKIDLTKQKPNVQSQTLTENNEAIQKFLIKMIMTLASIVVALLLIVLLMRNIL